MQTFKDKNKSINFYIHLCTQKIQSRRTLETVLFEK